MDSHGETRENTASNVSTADYISLDFSCNLYVTGRFSMSLRAAQYRENKIWSDKKGPNLTFSE